MRDRESEPVVTGVNSNSAGTAPPERVPFLECPGIAIFQLRVSI
jgi:hypothetical protein